MVINRKRIERDIKSLFCHRCTVYEYEEYAEGDVTKHKEVLKYQDIECRLSYTTGVLFGKMKSSQMKGDALKSEQSIKLFLPINVDIRAGSKIVVNHDNITEIFINSSQPSRFKHHIEVLLAKNEEWA